MGSTSSSTSTPRLNTASQNRESHSRSSSQHRDSHSKSGGHHRETSLNQLLCDANYSSVARELLLRRLVTMMARLQEETIQLPDDVPQSIRNMYERQIVTLLGYQDYYGSLMSSDHTPKDGRMIRGQRDSKKLVNPIIKYCPVMVYSARKPKRIIPPPDIDNLDRFASNSQRTTDKVGGKEKSSNDFSGSMTEDNNSSLNMQNMAMEKMSVTVDFEGRNELILTMKETLSAIGEGAIKGVKGARGNEVNKTVKMASSGSTISVKEELQSSDECDEGNRTMCPICWIEYDEGTRILVLPCFHWIHESCGIDWLSRRPECPLCQLSVVSTLRNLGAR